MKRAIFLVVVMTSACGPTDEQPIPAEHSVANTSSGWAEDSAACIADRKAAACIRLIADEKARDNAQDARIEMEVARIEAEVEAGLKERMSNVAKLNCENEYGAEVPRERCDLPPLGHEREYLDREKK